jgi:gluconate 2-dehydrogenase gamma chain
MSISRRDLLKSLSMTALAGSAFRGVSLEVAQHAHTMVSVQRAAGYYTPKFFSAHQYETLRALCQAIIPPGPEGGGALEAGAPEFIDLLTSENKDFQLQYGGGILWLDSTCTDQYGQTYLKCTSAQQEEILNLIAFRKSTEKDPRLGPGIEFFSALRKITADGFFTSEIGIRYVGYVGNTYLKEFPGCPAVPEA